ncbi:LacI family DNA-binding transcriptional regulator [Cobetia amphilecti]|uniref:LacI family DNA-binding transcriptional regulator n=1 Tax=Cobetia amphilecti TaxID=1055104 RepID=UPI001CDA77BA|nr:LacI family DNA-binding transcriptional regulator [Cobetia amphilecti]UBU49965.1 LacI family DNA-binding transcriptional regulator [Cobetia amphilecti]
MKKSEDISSSKRVTITEVAKEANVSIAAVSRAMNPEGSSSPEMRSRILAVAERMGYKPNRLARGIKSQSSLIGILVTNFENPVYLAILSEFSAAIQRHNCHTLLINVNTEKSISEAVSLVMEYHVDALIVTSASVPPELVEACAKQNTPVAIFGRDGEDSGACVVTCDDVEMGRMAADHLIDLGYRRLAYVGASTKEQATLDRKRGFIERLEQRGLTLHGVGEGYRHSYDAGYEATCELFAEAEVIPDSIFYFDDIMACGGMDAIRHEFSHRIPQDIGIVGVDDIRFASSKSYDLTTICQPFTEMVNKTVSLLFARIKQGGMAPSRVIMPCQITQRGSTRHVN